MWHQLSVRKAPLSAFSVTSRSIFKELENWLTHTHPLFRSYTATLFSILEEATKSIIYSLTINPFNPIKDGRVDYYASMNSYEGQHKWEQI